MTTDISQLNMLNTSKLIKQKENESEIAVNNMTSSNFLSITDRFNRNNIVMNVERIDTSAVLSGNVQKEIEKIQNEEDQIAQILKANVTASTNTFASDAFLSTVRPASVAALASTAKTIGFVQYAGGSSTKLNSKTNTANILNSLAYDSGYDMSEQQKSIKNGIQVMVDWLDDLINNYDARTTSGLAAGQSEAKLSFLLGLRKSIENCDFPVGFTAMDNSDPNRVTLGAYQWSYIPGEFLNPTDNANDNVGTSHHMNRSILLNAAVYMPQRKYTTEQEVINAIAAGEEVTYNEVYLANDDAYYKFTGAYMAATLVHEFVHSMHITNEAVTYFTCEILEDDFFKKKLETNYNSTLSNAIPELKNVTYGDIMIPYTETAFLGFGHGLGNTNSVASHGHDENNAYSSYTGHTTGNTLADDKKELLNFTLTA